MNTVDTAMTERPTSISTTIPDAVVTYSDENRPSLRDSVELAVGNYFQHLEGQEVTDVYEMVMAEVETPLLEVVMKYTRHNQTKAAQLLGLNRGTLRKKLKQYGLL